MLSVHQTEAITLSPKIKAVFRKLPPAHIYLIGVFPVFALFSQNTAETDPTEILAPCFFIALCATLAWAIMYALYRNTHKAALAVSIAIVLGFTFTPLYDLTKNIQLGPIRFQFPIVMMSLLALIAIAAYLALFRMRGAEQTLSKILNKIAAITLTVSIASTLFTFGSTLLEEPTQLTSNNTPITYNPELAIKQKPDVYYILLDMYGRSDTHRDIYNEDTTPFINHLQNSGFFVAQQAYANYPETLHSMSSCLNMNYTPQLVNASPESTNRKPLAQLILNNRVASEFQSLGYHYIAFSAEYDFIDCQSADTYLQPDIIAFTKFQDALLNLTPIMHFNRVKALVASSGRKRTRVNYTLQNLPNIANIKEPTFTYAHLMVPHWPFVFDENGAPTESTPEIAAKLSSPHTTAHDRAALTQEYAQGYVQQLRFINQQLTTAIDKILAQSQTPPIIIIQADHGPSTTPLDHDNPQATLQSFAILNAFHFPHGGDKQLYPSISPVNTFRALFSFYFGASLPPLPDESYWSGYHLPYQFVRAKHVPVNNSTQTQLTDR